MVRGAPGTDGKLPCRRRDIGTATAQRRQNGRAYHGHDNRPVKIAKIGYRETGL